MSKNSAFGRQVTEILTTGTVPSWVNTTTTPNLWVSLHTDDPDEGNQSTHEVSYTGYARQPIARSAGAWNITILDARNANEIVFPAPTGGVGDEVWFLGIGLSQTGPGTLLISSNVLDPIYTVAISDPITIPIGNLRIRER